MGKKRYSMTQEQIDLVPTGDWYKYTLECGHEYYIKARIMVPKDKSFQEHYIDCRKRHDNDEPVRWIPIVGMEAVTNEHVSNVLSGDSFILPNRLLRAGNFNPFPYSIGKNRDY